MNKLNLTTKGWENSKILWGGLLTACCLNVVGVMVFSTNNLRESMTEQECNLIEIADVTKVEREEYKVQLAYNELEIGASRLETVTVALAQEPVEYVITVPSVRAKKVTNDIPDVNISKLLRAYDEAPYMSFCSEEKMGIVNFLWTFLVEEKGVDEKLASGIIGNVLCEGDFAEVQGGTRYLTSLKNAKDNLYYTTNTGYGIAQWTTSGRKDLLYKYYSAVSDIMIPMGFVWEDVVKIAEACCLYEELKLYNIYEKYENLSESKQIQGATGLVAVKYESYKGVENQWSYSNGTYRLTAGAGTTGCQRYEYAKCVYEFYME